MVSLFIAHFQSNLADMTLGTDTLRETKRIVQQPGRRGGMPEQVRNQYRI